MKEDGFCCVQCSKWRKPEELHLSHGNSGGSKYCVYCYAKSIEKAANESRSKAQKKSAVKSYKAGKLPPWMFS